MNLEWNFTEPIAGSEQNLLYQSIALAPIGSSKTIFMALSLRAKLEFVCFYVVQNPRLLLNKLIEINEIVTLNFLTRLSGWVELFFIYKLLRSFLVDGRPPIITVCR